MERVEEELYLLRVQLRQNPKVWASVLVPSDYSLVQLHILLLDIFSWKESPYTAHAFHQTNNQLNISDDSQVCISPYITYQTISPEDCEGWLVEIGPGVFIEHSNPHDPSPTFNLGTEELEPLALRQLRDERVYTLKAAFQCSSQLDYEFDPIEEIHSFSVSIVIVARSPLTTKSCDTGLKHPPIVVASHLTTFEKIQLKNHSFTKLNLQELQQIQGRINITHDSTGLVCYICRFYAFDCWCSRHWPSCSLYNSRSTPSCCDMCPGNESFLSLVPQSEETISTAWNQAANHLITLRQRFLEKPTPANSNSPTKC